MKGIGILGAGSWGLALSRLLSRKGLKVAVWESDPQASALLDRKRERPEKLPGVKIPSQVEISSSLSEVVSGREFILFTLPSHCLRVVSKKLSDIPLSGPILVSGTKGIENESLMTMSQILREELRVSPERIAVISGPSHAEEVARGIPTTVVSASQSLATARRVLELFITPDFRVYTNPDVLGVELGGALKNIIAIAAGICDGLKLGDNTKGALLTRGLAEMVRLGKKMGANPVTFSGLSGIGDLITTCTSKFSRNRFVGEKIGEGKRLNEVLEGMTMVAEGVKTTHSAYNLSQRYGVEMPITKQMYEVLFKGKSPKVALLELMTREPKAEVWD